MTVVTDPYSIMAQVLQDAILAEFSDEPYLDLRHDRIHESLGEDGRTYVGLSPEAEPAADLDLRQEILVQFYGGYSAEVNPHQMVDPRGVTNKAERMRRALQAVTNVATPEVWYFNVVNTRYPNDPTGNKTRFEMLVIGHGSNTGLVETIG